MDECVQLECEWEEWGVFVFFLGQWWLVGETWWEHHCIEIYNSPALAAGHAAPASRPIITVVLVPDTAFHGRPARSVLRRFAGEGARRGVVMLRESTADEAQLSNAVAGMRAWFKKETDDARAAELGLVQISMRKASKVHPWARDVFDRLKASVPRDVSGIGNYKAVDIN
jgi:hypothetical protein